jgi:hypothetical protein
MDLRTLWVAALPLLVACSSRPAGQAAQRAELRAVGPASVEVVPAAGQLPYCLLFTASERGVVRHLTMTPERRSVPCKAGEPVGGVTYRIPPEEGKVRLYLLLSDQALVAAPLATQIHEVASRGRPVTVMDLRAPGQVQIATLEFSPR